MPFFEARGVNIYNVFNELVHSPGEVLLPFYFFTLAASPWTLN